jgi:hypothetical protein
VPVGRARDITPMRASEASVRMKSSLSAVIWALLLATALQVATASGQSAVRTGKERLGEKASDEQRVDNCKVPPERWGKVARSASCAQGATAGVTH